jgi:hypothetical protein
VTLQVIQEKIVSFGHIDLLMNLEKPSKIDLELCCQFRRGILARKGKD